MSTMPIAYPLARNYIRGVFRELAGRSMAVQSPLDGSTISSVPLSGREVLDEAVVSRAGSLRRLVEMDHQRTGAGFFQIPGAA